MKTIIFTRKDIDGVGCEILCKLAYGEDVETIYVDDESVDKTFIDFFNIDTYYDTEEEKDIYNVFGNDKLYSYDGIYLTGVAVCPDLLYRIGRNSVINRRFQICDYHDFSRKTGVAHYLFNDVRSKNETGQKYSASRIFYENLVKKGVLNRTRALDGFVEATRLIDSGEWKELSSGKEVFEEHIQKFNELGEKEYAAKIMERLTALPNQDFSITQISDEKSQESSSDDEPNNE